VLASISDVLTNATLVGAIVGAAGLGATVIIYRRQRIRKSLAYAVTNTPLVSIRSEARDKIQITYDGEPVKGVHLVSFSLSNVGNQPVSEEDGVVPLRYVARRVPGVRLLLVS
jgi:hypothetical protein